MFKNLTGHEIDTLPQYYNLTDGHAFWRWFAAEEAIVDRSGLSVVPCPWSVATDKAPRATDSKFPQ